MKTYKERTASILVKAERMRNKRKRIFTLAAATAAAAVLVVFGLVLFVPYTVGGTDITAYKSSEYYDVIQKLYGLTYSPHRTNNFTEWFGGLGSGEKGGAVMDGDISSTAPEGGNDYRETTLNQTEGVTEGDLFKRNGKHMFYLGYSSPKYEVIFEDNNKSVVRVVRDAAYVLRVYTLAGEDSRKVAEYTILPEGDMSFNGYGDEREMYLSEDSSTVTVLTPCYDGSAGVVYTAVISIDVSDIDDIAEKSRTYVSGRYLSSRVADGSMLVISDFTVRSEVDFGNPALYLPHAGKIGQLQALSAEDIICPENANTARYTVIYSLDGDRNVTDSVALMSFSDDVYVSKNNLFVTREYTERVTTGNEFQLTYTYDKSEIRIIPYGGGGLGDTRSVTVSGTVRDRFCLDEYDGTLRAATTVGVRANSYTYKGADPYKGVFGDRCLLYCIDMNTLEVTAKVSDFAPVGESVKSARFYGDTAYVCTAEENFDIGTIWDPVFAFDLGDLSNITYKDTGTIPGYSLTLTQFAYDTLLGIGFGDDRFTLKIELYEQTDSAVKSVAKHEVTPVRFSDEFKAYMIDAKNGLVGLGVTGADTSYKIFRYDGYDLTEIYSVKMATSEPDDMRAVEVGGHIYILENTDDTDGLTVVKTA